MLQFKDHFPKILKQLKLEQIYNVIVLIIIVVVIVISFVAAVRPISSEQYFKIQKIALQQTLPETQEMAHLMMMQEKITRVDFYRLMHAQHQESSSIQKYPAVNIDDQASY